MYEAAAMIMRIVRLIRRPKKNLGTKIDAFLDECDQVLSSPLWS